MAKGRIGFVGLGEMGGEIVARLIEQGWEVVVWNRSRGPVEEAAAGGAIPAQSPEECVATGLVFSILAHEAAVDAVFTEELLAGAPAGTVHVNMATISAAAGERFAARHAAARVGYVGTPVLGRSNVARSGNLVALVSGAAADVEKARPALEDFTRRIWSIGETIGDSNSIKIEVNFLILHALQAISEAVATLEGREIDGQLLIDIVSDSLFPGPVYSGYGSLIAKRQYEPAGFSTTLGRKDLGLALEAAEAVGLALPSAEVLRHSFDTAIERGLADADWASIAEVVRSAKR